MKDSNRELNTKRPISPSSGHAGEKGYFQASKSLMKEREGDLKLNMLAQQRERLLAEFKAMKDGRAEMVGYDGARKTKWR